MNAPLGHNLPPVTAPSTEEALSDLQRRFPELETEQKDFEEALATYPEVITDDDTAAALQDVLGKIKKHQSVLSAHKKTEKKPWDGIVKVVQNFFSKYDEKLDKMLETWGPRHQAYLEKKKAEALRKAEEEAKKQREEADRLRREAEEAEERKRKAEEEERLARQREEEARLRAEEEDRKRKEAEARAAAAKEEADRIDRERREREKAEKEENAANLREIKRLIRDAERLGAAAENGDLGMDGEVFDDLVLEGGQISRLGSKLRASHLLDDEQAETLKDIQTRLQALRTARSARLKAAEDAAAAAEAERRRKAEEEAEAKAQAAAAAREAQRRADEEAAAKARAEREAAEREAEAAKANAKALKAEARSHAADAREAYADQKEAAKAADILSDDADRTENRADRIERKIEKSTDADLSRTRGELGTVGSLSKSWNHHIVDEDALRAALRASIKDDPEFAPYGVLIDQMRSEAFNGAVFRFMRLHQSGWKGRTRVDDVLAGVVFAYEQDAAIRT